MLQLYPEKDHIKIIVVLCLGDSLPLVTTLISDKYP